MRNMSLSLLFKIRQLHATAYIAYKLINQIVFVDIFPHTYICPCRSAPTHSTTRLISLLMRWKKNSA